MRAAHVQPLRRAIRERQGELRDVANERNRHALRRVYALEEKRERDTWH